MPQLKYTKQQKSTQQIKCPSASLLHEFIMQRVLEVRSMYEHYDHILLAQNNIPHSNDHGKIRVNIWIYVLIHILYT